MVLKHVGDATGQSFAHWDVQEFVGAVSVGLGAENSGDEELGLREFFTEHPHEWDRAAFAHVDRFFAKVGLRSIVR